MALTTCSVIPPPMPFSISSMPLLSPLPALPEVPFCCNCFLQRVNTIPMPRSRGKEEEEQAKVKTPYATSCNVIYSCSTSPHPLIQTLPFGSFLSKGLLLSPSFFPLAANLLPFPPTTLRHFYVLLTCSYIVELLKSHQHIRKVPLLIQQVGWLENLH